MEISEIIAEIADRPVRERAKIAAAILSTLNQPDPQIEQAWLNEMDRRVKEDENGGVQLTPGEEVLEELKEIKT